MNENTNMLTSNGRISRSTYWLFQFAFFAAIYLIGEFTGAFIPPGAAVERADHAQALFGLAILFLVLFAWMMQIKRWHDRGKSGWWVFINLLPIIGGLWAFIELGLLRGTPGPNEYGPDPLQ